MICEMNCRRSSYPHKHKRIKYVKPELKCPYSIKDLDRAANKTEYIDMLKEINEVIARSYGPQLIGPPGAKCVVYKRPKPIPDDAWEVHLKNKKQREDHKKELQMFCDARGIPINETRLHDMTDFYNPKGLTLGRPHDDKLGLDIASPTPEEPEGQPSGKILEIVGKPSLESSGLPLHPTDVDLDGSRRIEGLSLDPHIVGSSLGEEALVENAKEKKKKKRKSKVKKKKLGHMKVSGDELAVLVKRVIRKEFKTLKKDLLQTIKERKAQVIYDCSRKVINSDGIEP